ncbi:hypothetical protein QF000_007883 [Paraburkholderia atlantica]
MAALAKLPHSSSIRWLDKESIPIGLARPLALTATEPVARRKNRNKSKIRARVEHVFAVVKRLWGFTKVRYRGLTKNANRAFVALALANLYLSRGRFTGQVRP